MKRRNVAVLLAVLVWVVLPMHAAQGDVVWFRFTKTFIQSMYPADLAFGTIDAGDLWTVGPRARDREDEGMQW